MKPRRRAASPAGATAQRIPFCTVGLATIDINLRGRPLEDESEDETDVNTDMGNVEPIKGPQFYSTALHETWKRNRQLDKYAIDPRRTAVVLFVRRLGSTHVDFPGIEMTHPRAV